MSKDVGGAGPDLERLGEMFQQAPCAIALLRGNGHVCDMANPAYLELIGRDVLGKSMADGLPEVVAQGFCDLLDRVYGESPACAAASARMRLHRGTDSSAEDMVVDLVYKPMTDGDGSIVGIFVNATDVTERVRAEQALQEREQALRRSEKRLGRLFETNLLGVLYFDIDGSVQDANDEFLRVIGYDREDLRAGRVDWAEMTPQDFKAQDARAVKELRRTGRHAPIEKQYLRKDGSRVWVLVGSAMIEGDNGVGYVLDLTGLKAANAALLEADRRKDEFLATLAHELRNPLAPIRNAVLLMQSNPTEKQAHTAREIIGRQVQHMVRLVDDLLEVSRITLGQVSLHHGDFTLAQAVGDAIDAVGPMVEASGHTLDVHLQPQPLRLQGDTTRMSQVFQNLLDNACKYTPRGGRITLRAQRVGDEVVVAVKDNGVGVPKEMQTRVFELFTRTHPLDDIKVSGLGIGLALSKQLIELHGGRIELESEGTGKGSEFRVWLPLVEPAPSDAPAAPRAAFDLAGDGRRVLVVDDNKDAAESLAMLLRHSGSIVEAAFDGPQALEVLESFEPEIVLLDIGMPGMDGYQVAQRMRATPTGKSVKLVALTGFGQAHDKSRALDSGFDEHVTKPMDPGTLQRLLNEASGKPAAG